jgi:Uma2 family endonuclease
LSQLSNILEVCLEVYLMIEVLLDKRRLELPYLIRIFGVTEGDFDCWTDEDTRAELLDGEMIIHPPATLRHDGLGGFLSSLMRLYAEAKGLGKVLGPNSIIHLATSRKFAPDILFIRQERVPLPLTKEFQGAADLVVEVLSESTRRYDLGEKRRMYHEAGITELWFVDEAQQQLIIDLKEGTGYRQEVVRAGRGESAVLPGFWVEVAWLWQEPTPELMICLQRILGRAQ